MASSTSSTLQSIGGGNGMKMGGLVSGLDTATLVKQMAAGTKNKINKQQQQLDLLSWKQNDIRSIITKINQFKTDYFSYSSANTNLKSSALMNAFKAESSNSHLAVTAGANAGNSSFEISGIQKATTAELQSVTQPLTGKIQLDFSGAAAGDTYHITATLDGVSKEISLTGGATAADTQANLNTALKDAFGTRSDGTARMEVNANGELQYQGDDASTVTHTFDIGFSTLDYGYEDSAAKSRAQQAALNALGLKDTTSNKITKSTALGVMNLTDKLVGGSFDFEINGEKFSFDRNTTLGDMMNTINKSNAGVNMTFDSLSQTFKLAAKDSGANGAIEIKQTSGNLLTSLFGVDTAKSATSYSVKQVGITGQTSARTDWEDMANKSFNISVTDLNGNTVTKKIGLYMYDATGVKRNFADYDYTDANGNTKTNYGGTRVAGYLNEELKREFGSNAPQFKYDETARTFTLLSGNYGDTVKITDGIADNGGDALVKALGMDANRTNELTGDTDLVALMKKGGLDITNLKFDIGGNTIDVATQIASNGGTLSVDDFNTMLGSNGSFDPLSGTLKINGQVSATGADNRAALETLFGAKYADINSKTSGFDGSAGIMNKIQGANGSITISKNGGPAVTMAMSENNVTIDGTNFDFSKLTATDIANVNGANGAAGTPITVDTVRDSSKAKEAVMKFVEAYNELMTDLNTAVTTRRPTSNGKINGTKYDPLTEEQREDMSDKEIERWEEKAKTGMLYGDSNISALMTKMRTAMLTATPNKFNLAKMGISTKSFSNSDGTISTNPGLLEFDEAKFNEAFENNPEEIASLFTDSEKGLMANVEKALDSAVDRVSGSLILMAGQENTSTSAENTLSKQIQRYSDAITALKKKYQSEQERYWNQFSQLEVQLSKLSSQSDYFSQFSGA